MCFPSVFSVHIVSSPSQRSCCTVGSFSQRLVLNGTFSPRPSLLLSLAQALRSPSTGSTEGKAAAPASYMCVFGVLFVCVSPTPKPLLLMNDPQNPSKWRRWSTVTQWAVVSMVPLPVHPCPFSCLTYDVITILDFLCLPG